MTLCLGLPYDYYGLFNNVRGICSAIKKMNTVATADTFKPFHILHGFLKAWSHRANGEVTDKKSFHPFVSVLCPFLIQ